MSQRRRTLATGKTDEVPFGIRAIESGLEVDGVWISRNNTPEPVSRDSSTNGISDGLPKRQTVPDLERHDVHTGYDRSTSASSANTAHPASSSFDRAVSAERMSSRQTSRDASPDATVTKPPRSRQPPCSYTRYSGNPYILRNSSTTNTLEGIEAIYRASTSIHHPSTLEIGDGGYSSAGSSSHSSNGELDIESIYASAPGLLSGPRPRTRQQSSDLNMLDNHRISQVAETGQLTPRARRATETPTMLAEQVDYFGLRKNSQPTVQDAAVSSFPKADALPESLQKLSMPDVTPFAQFVKNSPPSPSSSRPTSKQSESGFPQRPMSRAQSPSAPALAYSTVTAPPLTTVANPSEPRTTSPPIPPKSEKRRASPNSSRSHRSSFDGPSRASQVLRGHGTGFEILRPGSLHAPAPNLADGMEQQRAAPPVSMYNHHGYTVTSGRRSNSSESRRKLQKKRRPSVDSQSSWETGSRGTSLGSRQETR